MPAPMPAQLGLSGLAFLFALVLAPAADDPAPPAAAAKPATAGGVAAIRERHDRALMTDLRAYLDGHPDAADRETGYLTLFETAIAHDWYVDAETAARDYLKRSPEGAVRSMAQIVATMARAKAGQYDQALADYQALIAGLEGAEQLEFASTFTDSLATEATAAGQYDAARQVYETLLKRFGDDEALAGKVRGDLARLDLVGQPAPDFRVNDLENQPVALAALRGKPVLIDFWATWSGPNLDALPALRAAHERGLTIVSVSLDEQAAPVILAAKEQKLTWPQVHNGTCGTDIAAAYQVNTIPASVLIGADGKVLRLDLRGPALERALDGLLPRQTPATP